jgi:uncharacterized protein (DUF58 family)
MAILVVVVVGAIMREINLLIILAGLMAGPLLMSWQLIRLTLRNLTITRQVPSGVFPGQAFVVEFTVHNRRRRLDSWAIVIEDRVTNVQPAQTAGAAVRERAGQVRPGTPDLPRNAHDPVQRSALCLVPYVAAGKSARASYRATLWQRGRYRFGPVRLSTKVPVGLLSGRVTYKLTTDLLVYPKIGRLRRPWSDMVKYDQLGSRSWRRQQGPVEGDFFGLRNWRPGDSRRWIHWRSSAKRQELVVRQFEQHRRQDLVVYLDLSLDARLPHTRQASAEQIEAAISFAATVVADHCRRGGGRLTLAVAGQTSRLLHGAASSALLNDALELLAEATATRDDPLPRQLPEVLMGASPGDRLLIITVRATDPLDDRRFAAVPEGKPRASLQQAVVVNVRSDQFAQLFESDDSPDTTTCEVVQ